MCTMIGSVEPPPKAVKKRHATQSSLGSYLLGYTEAKTLLDYRAKKKRANKKQKQDSSGGSDSVVAQQKLLLIQEDEQLKRDRESCSIVLEYC